MECYPHINPKFRHCLSLSDEERITFIRESRWIGYSQAREILQPLEEMLNYPKKPRMPNILLVGESNNGKTTLIHHFYKKHGETYEDEDLNLVNPVAESLFDSYHDKLLAKHHTGKTSISSIRLAMQPVVGLMQGFNHFPIQEDIDAYLRKKPEQRAALTGFISYLRREYALDLHISKVTKKDQQRMKVAKRNALEKR